MNKIYFTKEMIDFYETLARNNNKEWFAENRHIYDNKIIPDAPDQNIIPRWVLKGGFPLFIRTSLCMRKIEPSIFGA